MLAAAMTAATTMGAGVKGSTRRHEMTAWNRAAHAHSHLPFDPLRGWLAEACSDLQTSPALLMKQAAMVPGACADCFKGSRRHTESICVLYDGACIRLHGV